jgi:phosphohistidine phosphatase SixA
MNSLRQVHFAAGLLAFVASSGIAAQPHHAHGGPAPHGPAPAGAPHGHESPLHAPPQIYLLAEQLRRGGLVVFLRHAKTAHDGRDQPDAAPGNCASQRNLSPAGRALSEEMGDATRSLGIPVGEVRASPWCRAMDTARLAFGRVEPEPALAVDPRQLEASATQFWRLAQQAPAAGSNTVLVGHLLPPLMALGMKIDESEAIVLRPGASRPQVLGRINAVQWGDLARDWRAHGEKVFMFARHERPSLAAPGHGPHAPPPHELGHGASVMPLMPHQR